MFRALQESCLEWVRQVDGYVSNYRWSAAELHDVVYLMLQVYHTPTTLPYTELYGSALERLGS